MPYISPTEPLWTKSFYTMMWMPRALWLVVAHDLLEDLYIDYVTGNLFFVFVQHGARFWTCLWDYFGLKQVKAWTRFSRSYFTNKENGETKTKRALDYLRMPKLQEIFTKYAIVCHRYERLDVLQNVFAIILLWARKDVENFSKKLYTSKIKNKRKSRDEKWRLGLKKFLNLFKYSNSEA